MTLHRIGLRARLRASGVHMLISGLIALAAAVIVLYLWYPPPYDQLSGGRKLFLLLVSVDVVVGPLLTLVVFNVRKPRRELVRDLGIIGLFQLIALSYGLHTVFIARPVACVLEHDRFRVVAANQVLAEELPSAPNIRNLSLTGPVMLGVRKARGDETMDAVEKALKGYDTGQRPAFWIPYDRNTALQAAHPVSALKKRYADNWPDIESRLVEMQLTVSGAYYLPVIAHADNWLAVLDSQGNLAGFMPYDGF